jgi:hypothetical protein
VTIKALRTDILACVNLFMNIERFRVPFDIIKDITAHIPGNNSDGETLPKAILINHLYSTAIRRIDAMARHISTLNIDDRLEVGDISVITDIRQGHGIGRNGKDFDFYSFATKYAAFHNPSAYPMYDSLLSRLFSRLQKVGILEGHISMAFHRDYSHYKGLVDRAAAAMDLADLSYDLFDKGLWIYAKYHFKPEQFTPDERDSIGSSLTMRLTV